MIVRDALDWLPSESIDLQVTVLVPIGNSPLDGHTVTTDASGRVIEIVTAVEPPQSSIAVTDGAAT